MSSGKPCVVARGALKTFSRNQNKDGNHSNTHLDNSQLPHEIGTSSGTGTLAHGTLTTIQMA